MGEKKLEVVWTKRSQLHMKKIFEYISTDSAQNALKVLGEIIAAVSKATANPEFYNPDKYKQNNDGSYRSFELYHYRVTYRFDKKIIRVLRVKHTAMEPKDY